MKVDTQVDHNKWLQLQNALRNTHVRPLQTSRIKLLLVDNFFIFLLQLTGYSLNHYISGQPLVFLSTGIGLALLLLKGNAIIPGLLLSAVISQLNINANLLTASYFACYQIIPLIICNVFIYRYVGATLFTSSWWRQLVLYITMILTASIITLSADATSSTLTLASIWMAHLNGLLVMSMAVLLFDLYFVDWCETTRSDRMQLANLLLLWLFFLCCGLSIMHSSWGFWLLLPTSCLLLSWLMHVPHMLGIISALLITVFLQLGISFFLIYPINTTLCWQSLLFLNAIYAMYLMRKESAST